MSEVGPGMGTEPTARRLYRWRPDKQRAQRVLKLRRLRPTTALLNLALHHRTRQESSSLLFVSLMT